MADFFDGDFKWLVNPGDTDFTFTYDSKHYTVPAKSKRMLPREVAEHGEKRSYALTDPVFAEDGRVVSTGNDVLKLCKTESANDLQSVEFTKPILVEKSREKITDPAQLAVDPTKQLRMADFRGPHLPPMELSKKGKEHPKAEL